MDQKGFSQGFYIRVHIVTQPLNRTTYGLRIILLQYLAFDYEAKGFISSKRENDWNAKKNEMLRVIQQKSK